MSTNTFTNTGFVMVDDTPNSGHVVCHSIDASITAGGSNAATATLLVSSVNVVTTAAASTGVALPAVVAPGAMIDVFNNTGTVFTAYPPAGGTINGGSINAGVTIAAVSSGVAGKGSFIQTAALTYLSK